MLQQSWLNRRKLLLAVVVSMM